MKTVVDLSVSSAQSKLKEAWAPSLLFTPGVLGCWYDPSDAASVFSDTGGTQVALLDEPVARIEDKSGNGFHATQAIAAARPILRQDANGLRYLDFDGIDDRLGTAPMNLSAHQKLTVIAGVHKRDGGTARAIAGHSAPSLSPGGFDLLTATGANHTLGILARSSAGSSAQCGVTSFELAPLTFVMLGRFDYGATAGAEIQLRLNGQDISQNIGTSQENIGSFGSGPLSLGARPNNSLFLNGKLFGFVLVVGETDAATTRALENHAFRFTGINV